MLGADVIVVEEPGFLLGEDDDAPRLVSEPLEHERLVPFQAAPPKSPSSVHPSAQDRRARNAAVLTRFWHEVEQYRRVPLREVST